MLKYIKVECSFCGKNVEGRTKWVEKVRCLECKNLRKKNYYQKRKAGR